MSTLRDVRRVALQVLYQLDACGDGALEEIRGSLEEAPGSEQSHQDGYDLGMAAWTTRAPADELATSISPHWPTKRQPVIDRSLIRLGYHELTTNRAPHKVVINEAVELAREFSTEQSPMFINAVLDKMYRVLNEDTPLEAIEPIEATSVEESD